VSQGNCSKVYVIENANSLNEEYKIIVGYEVKAKEPYKEDGCSWDEC